MKVAVLGSGAVGGYYGALLARAGHDVTFIARGAHLDAIRSQGLRVRGPLGDWQIRARAEHDTAGVGHVDLVLLAVKTYDNDTALPLLAPLVGTVDRSSSRCRTASTAPTPSPPSSAKARRWRRRVHRDGASRRLA